MAERPHRSKYPPSSLAFGAEDTTPQEITVTATGVEWEYTLPLVGRLDYRGRRNGRKTAGFGSQKPDRREAYRIHRRQAREQRRRKAKSVTVTQAGSETPEVYSLTVDPAALTFEAEVPQARVVKVTASGEGLPGAPRLMRPPKSG